MTPPAPIPPQPLADADRASGVDAVVARTMVRREAGERVTDAEVIAEHPDLMPELAPALRLAADVHRAYLAARRNGRAPGEAIKVLSDEELDAAIDVPSNEAEDVGEVGGSAPRIAGYEIIAELPRGGQAVVYAATRTSTGRRVAVKVLTDGRNAPPRARRRFEREALVLAALDHPHLVSVIDAGTTADGAPFLVMPYVEGRPLDEHLTAPLAAGGLGEAGVGPVLQLFERLARALHAAHLAGVVHRDLKPANIRIDANGEPRVLDFGLARMTDPDARDVAGAAPVVTSVQVLGTLPWMSPEQAAGAGAAADGRTDVYALGVMLYWAIAGRSPYPEIEPPQRLLLHVVSTVPDEPSRSPTARMGVDRRVDAIVLKCLAKDPGERYASAADLADDLALWLAGDRPRALVDYAASRAARPSRLGAWHLAFAAATVSVAAVVWEGAGLGLLGPGKPVYMPPGTPGQMRGAPAAPTGDYVNGRTAMRLVRVPVGAFQRPPGVDHGSRMQIVPRPFWIGECEVTRRQYAALMGGPAQPLSESDRVLPVTNVTRAEAEAFCVAMSRTDGRRYRLPTEAEWEWAARCGRPEANAAARFGDRDTAAGVTWSAENSAGHPHPVKERSASRFGLWDMNGNVAEWCDNGPAPASGIQDDATPDRGVVRGGAFDQPSARCVNGAREGLPADQRRADVGFRVVMDFATPPRPEK